MMAARSSKGDLPNKACTKKGEHVMRWAVWRRLTSIRRLYQNRKATTSVVIQPFVSKKYVKAMARAAVIREEITTRAKW